MKHKLSITMDQETILGVFDQLKTGQFKNKSHVVECAIKKYLDDLDNQNENQIRKISENADALGGKNADTN